MNLPKYLNEKVNLVFSELKKNQLKNTQKILTDKYKNHTGNSKDLIAGKDESILYAVSRMPATYSVNYTLILDLINQGLLSNVKSVIDVGSGTGTVFFALKEIFPEIEISLYEKNQNMIDVFEKLSDKSVSVNKIDLIKENVQVNAELVTASYVLSELTENDRQKVFNNLLSVSSNYVLIIDTGTPDTYKNMMKLKDIAKKQGYSVIAPCQLDKCPLSGDYCQFYARVERSAVLRQAKSAELSYEDEKYFYLLFSKNPKICNGKRIIRRPKIKENEVELMLCSSIGVETVKITKKNKDLFKKSKKSKINHLL